MTEPLTRRASAWVYEGVWSVLTELFHVPREPPGLPTASGTPLASMRPCDGWLRYRKLSFAFTVLTVLVPLLVVGAILFVQNPLAAAGLLVPGLVLLTLGGLMGYVSLHLGYDTTWYVLSDRSLRIRRGVWTLHETTITFDNVQNVKITQGPLQRLLGFSDLVVETAGGGGGVTRQQQEQSSHVGLLEGIEAPQVLREQIMERVRASRTTGLGDPHEAAPTAGGPEGWTAAHLEALREIATHVATLRSRS